MWGMKFRTGRGSNGRGNFYECQETRLRFDCVYCLENFIIEYYYLFRTIFPFFFDKKKLWSTETDYRRISNEAEKRRERSNLITTLIACLLRKIDSNYVLQINSFLVRGHLYPLPRVYALNRIEKWNFMRARRKKDSRAQIRKEGDVRKPRDDIDETKTSRWTTR